ncbi:hypothetical protein LUZ60_012050 [Juncus effusus]|nr:hypothetical protein LUZ60_012050 [Juncus effusus]
MANILVVLVVFIIDLLAFILAIVAERRRNMATIETDQNNGYLYCSYESNVSTGYGIAAIVFMLGTQAIVMVVSRCFCCGGEILSGKHRAWAGICFFTCWFTFMIAEICLLAGSVRNAHHTKYFFDNGNPSCAILRKGVFAAGAAFIFFTGIFSQLLILLYSRAASASPFGSRGPTIGMTAF